MTEEEYENWEMVRYRMDNEGMEYCFEHYSSFEEIEDEEFHKLRLELLEKMREMRNFVKDKIEKLFTEAQKDTTKANELKSELDKWNAYKEYEDRFLDLFKENQ